MELNFSNDRFWAGNIHTNFSWTTRNNFNSVLMLFLMMSHITHRATMLSAKRAILLRNYDKTCYITWLLIWAHRDFFTTGYLISDHFIIAGKIFRNTIRRWFLLWAMEIIAYRWVKYLLEVFRSKKFIDSFSCFIFLQNERKKQNAMRTPCKLNWFANESNNKTLH